MDRPIIVPLDTSVSGGNSISLARALARQSGAAVHLVRIDPAPVAGTDGQLSGRRRRESWESYLDGMGRYFFSELGAHRVRTELVEGDRVVDALAAYARTRDAWMVVLAANGIAADGYSRGIETAARVGLESGIPVLLVHPETDTAAHAARGLDRVVVALSGSRLDAQLVDAAERIGGASPERRTVLHVHGLDAEMIAAAVRESGASFLVAELGSVTTALFRALDIPMLVVSRRGAT